MDCVATLIYGQILTAGGVNAPPVKMTESILPLTDDRTVALLTERADPGIADATVKDAVHIKLPHTDGEIIAIFIWMRPDNRNDETTRECRAR
jgi:hypothetical protein